MEGFRFRVLGLVKARRCLQRAKRPGFRVQGSWVRVLRDSGFQV